MGNRIPSRPSGRRRPARKAPGNPGFSASVRRFPQQAAHDEAHVCRPFAEPIAGPPSTDILLVSFDSDWRFGSEHSRHIADELRALGAQPRHVEIASPWGHDSFLMDVPAYHAAIAGLLSS